MLYCRSNSLTIAIGVVEREQKWTLPKGEIQNSLPALKKPKILFIWFTAHSRKIPKLCR